MRIVLVSYPYLPDLGGVERSVHNLAHFLAERGHQVAVVTHKERGFPFAYEPDGAIRVLRIHIPSPFDRDWFRLIRGKLYDALNALLLAAFCAAFRPQVVHCHLINVDTRYGARMARALGAGFVVSMRGGETEHWIGGREIRQKFVTKMLAEADRVTAVAGDLIEQGAKLLPSLRGKAEVVPNPADPERIRSQRGAIQKPAGGPYVLFAGRLEAMKDVATLIKAYHRLIERRPNFPLQLWIAGVGSLQQELERQAAEGAGNGGVRFLGRTSYSKTLALIDQAAMMALPSVFSEGCPNAVLEAMVLETPVVVSSLPALAELVEDGSSGLVFKMGDAEGLSRRIEELTDDPALGSHLASRARDQIATRHAPGPILERIEQIYGELC